MLFQATAGSVDALSRYDVSLQTSTSSIELFQKLYPMRDWNTLCSVDRSSRLWDGVSELSYQSGSALWQVRGAGATAYSNLANDIHRQRVASVTLALETSSSWCTGQTSDAWPLKSTIVAREFNYLVQNYGALIKPYCENPQQPLGLLGNTSSSIHYFKEFVCIAVAPKAFVDQMYIGGNNNGRSVLPPVVRLTTTDYSTASFSMVNAYIGLDSKVSVPTAFTNFSKKIADSNTIYALRYVQSSTTGALVNGPVCGFADCTTGLIAFAPVVYIDSLRYTCSPMFAYTDNMPFPIRGAMIGTTFYKQTGSTVFSSFNQAMASGSELKIGDALRNDIRTINVSASTIHSHVDYLLTLPSVQYFASQRAARQQTHILLKSGSTTTYLSSSIKAACTHVGLYSEDGIMIGYASFPTPQTFVYNYTGYYTPAFSQSNASRIVARLYLS